MTAVKLLALSGQMEDVEAVSSTAVKNTFAEVLDKAVARGIVAITRHDKTRAVLLSLPEYEALVKRAGEPLERMQAYFDQMLARMQGPGTDKAVQELFGAARPARSVQRRAVRR